MDRIRALEKVALSRSGTSSWKEEQQDKSDFFCLWNNDVISSFLSNSLGGGHWRVDSQISFIQNIHALLAGGFEFKEREIYILSG